MKVRIGGEKKFWWGGAAGKYTAGGRAVRVEACRLKLRGGLRKREDFIAALARDMSVVSARRKHAACRLCPQNKQTQKGFDMALMSGPKCARNKCLDKPNSPATTKNG